MGRRNNNNNNGWNGKPQKDRDGKYRRETARERRARLKRNEEAKEYCLRVLPFFLVGAVLVFTALGFAISKIPVGYLPAVAELRLEPQQQCGQEMSQHQIARNFVEDVIGKFPQKEVQDYSHNTAMAQHSDASTQSTIPGRGEKMDPLITSVEEDASYSESNDNEASYQTESPSTRDFVLEESFQDLDDGPEQQTPDGHRTRHDDPMGKMSSDKEQGSVGTATSAARASTHNSNTNDSSSYLHHSEDSISPDILTVASTAPSSNRYSNAETIWPSHHAPSLKPRKQVLTVLVDQSSASTAGTRDTRKFIEL